MTRSYRIVLLGCLLLGAGCFSPDATECPEGFFCPEGKYCAASQRVCIDENDTCANGTVDGDEVCDDGNIVDGDGCSADCDSDETCGNGTVDDAVGEVCDDSNTDDDDGCSADCDSNELCGNGIVDTPVGEVCDDGNNDGGDGCNAACLSDESCGNGFTDVLLEEPEFCDDGNNDDGDGCSANCKSGEGCGNGLIDEGEFCDGDGAGTGGETADCDIDCTPVTCGDGIVNTTDGEACDGDGLGAGGETADCNLDCTEQACGDGILNTTASELCDQGPISTTGCDSDCTFPSCNDGIFNDPAEVCDTNGDTVSCDDDCTLPACGDGHFNNPAEICDDGANTVDCDVDCTLPACNDGIFNDPAEICDTGGDTLGCDADCTLPACGDGHFNDPAEICDTGANTAGCDVDCTLPACNDGIFNDPAEICDTGGNTSSCDVDCTLPVCGDNLLNTAAFEECDDNNTASNDNCVFDLGCKLNVCGDGWRDQQGPVTEACDGDNAGTGGNQPGCDSDCTAPACHDGVFNDQAEACDDGNTDNGDDCIDCTLASCGDGFVDLQGPATESCDDAGLNGVTTCPYGTTSDSSPTCSICNGSCSGDNTGLTGDYCGDGTVDDPPGPTVEACDDNNGLACGTCSGTCTVNTLTAATGTITTPGDDGISNDGETFTLNDGQGNVLTFEFDEDDDCCSGNGRIGIDYVNNASSTTVATNIAAAIEAQRLASNINIGASSTGNVVTLTNTVQGGFGNQAITENVVSSSFTVTGMAGGKARDCLEDTACLVDNDCAPGLTCQGTGLNKTCLPEPVCGDGVVAGGEVCDDGNALACGTCNAACTATVAQAAATGSFVAVATASLVDGETFTIDDGINTAVVFEFDASDADDVVGANRVRVDVDDLGGLTDVVVADRMRSAINGEVGTLRVTASGATATVVLTHDQNTALGNQALADTVASAGFTRTGMSGGSGGNCVVGNGCTTEAVCEPDLTCSASTDLCE